MTSRHEAVVRDGILTELDPHFGIEREVTGRHWSGKSLRIDAVLRPRDSSGWKWQDVALGVEFKDEDALRGDFRNIASWAKQCIDYAHTDWNGYGYLPIFAARSSVIRSAPGWDADAAWRHFLGQFLVGDLVRHERHGWSFTLHGHHRMWSQARGVEQARHWSLRPLYRS